MTLSKKSVLTDIKLRMDPYSACLKEKIMNLNLLLVDKVLQSTSGTVMKAVLLPKSITLTKFYQFKLVHLADWLLSVPRPTKYSSTPSTDKTKFNSWQKASVIQDQLLN